MLMRYLRPCCALILLRPRPEERALRAFYARLRGLWPASRRTAARGHASRRRADELKTRVDALSPARAPQHEVISDPFAGTSTPGLRACARRARRIPW